MKVKVNLNVLPKIRDLFVGLKDRFVDFVSAVGRKIVAVLHLRGIAHFFKRSARGIVDFFANITDRVKGFFRACSRLVRRCIDAVKDFLSDFTNNVKRIPRHVARILRAALAWRPPQRTWSLLIALVAMGLGGYLIEGPARELATGKAFQWEMLVAIGILLASLGLLLGGMGVFLQTTSFRRYFAAALVCVLPVACAFGYQTLIYAQKLRLAEGAPREKLTRLVSGGVQLTVLFFGIGILLFFFVRTRILKNMMCYGGPGAFGSAAVGAVQGGALAFLTWHVFRWLGFVKDIGWFVQAVYAVPIEYFVGGGALLGALINGYFGFRRKTPPPEPVSGAATGLLVGSGVGYLALILCRWLATAKGVAWCAKVLRTEYVNYYFVGGGALLFASVAVFRGLRARRGPAGWKPRTTSAGTRPAVSSATRAAVSSGTRPAGTPGTRSAFGTGTRSAYGSGTRSAGTQSAGTRSAGTQSAGTQSAGTQSAGTQSAGTQSSGTQSSGTQSSSSLTAIDVDDLFD